MIFAIILADILMAAAFVLQFQHLPPQIPLFYSRTFGEDQLAETFYIFLLPVFMHIFIFLNLWIYNRFFIPDQLVRKIIDYTNWFIIVAFTGIFLKIIFFVS